MELSEDGQIKTNMCGIIFECYSSKINPCLYANKKKCKYMLKIKFNSKDVFLCDSKIAQVNKMTFLMVYYQKLPANYLFRF